MTNATAAAEIIEIAESLEDWAIAVDGDADEALTLIAIRNCARETLQDMRAAWGLYADGILPLHDGQILKRAQSILQNLING
jgi:hypothetical protein